MVHGLLGHHHRTMRGRCHVRATAGARRRVHSRRRCCGSAGLARPASGQRAAATTNVSIAPGRPDDVRIGDQNQLGIGSPHAAIGGRASIPNCCPSRRATRCRTLVAASCGMPSVEALSASSTGTGCRLAPSRVDRNVASDSPGEYVTTTTEMLTDVSCRRAVGLARAIGRSGPR